MSFAKYRRLAAILGHYTGCRFLFVRGPITYYYAKNYKARDLVFVALSLSFFIYKYIH